MRTNLAVKHPAEQTHEGAQAARITSEQELRRTVAACLLWEDGFYESGESIADRIKALVPKCRAAFVAACAFEARTKMKLRHVPLLLAREMARHDLHRGLVGKLLPSIIQRADELSEFLAIYWKDKRQPLSKQVKVGLAAAFGQFNEYALAKYNRDGAVKLRDVLFLCHAKPKDDEQAALWKRLVDGKLVTPDTWEVALSGGADKAATFARLMAEKQLGALAFLRNLRNMHEAGVDAGVVQAYGQAVDIARVLPFRFIAAARAAPAWEHIIEPMMLRACEGREKLAGKTVVLLDVSCSMDAPISAKSDLQRLDAACGVAILLREMCADVEVMTFSEKVVQVPARRGFALRDAIVNSQQHSGTYLGAAVTAINEQRAYDRLVVLTDEQSADKVPAPKSKGYVINVASNKNGVGYGPWTHIDGWSEACIDYIQECEKQSTAQ
jgi:60 kDa SS-A/Ro ribonucleoprotein